MLAEALGEHVVEGEYTGPTSNPLGYLHGAPGEAGSASGLGAQLDAVVGALEPDHVGPGRLAGPLAGHVPDLCVGGAEDQALSAWRGATVANLPGFDMYFRTAKDLKLEETSRPRPTSSAQCRRASTSSSPGAKAPTV